MEATVRTLLETYGINDQRTSAWHQKRGEMLTASEIWKSFPDASPSARHELLMSKLTPPKSNGSSAVGALVWGTRFEPIAKEIYSKEEGVTIVDTTCVKHPVYEFLGASPDGILLTEDPNDHRYGRLIEFKCPISRAFDEQSPIPPHYVHQMQMQMECTGLKECVYAEYRFQTMFYSEWTTTSARYKSAFAVCEDGSVLYRAIDDPRPIQAWIQTELADHEYAQVHYWVLQATRNVLVPVDPEWMPTHLPSMKATWDEIVAHRVAGTLPESPKEKHTLTL